MYSGKISRLIPGLLLLMSLSLAVPANANVALPELSIDEIDPVLNKIESDLRFKHFLLANLDDYLEQLPVFDAWAMACVERAENELDLAKSNLSKLGFAADGEPREVNLTRSKIKSEKQRLENELASCNAIQVRSKSAIKKISAFRKDKLQQKSFDQGMSIIPAIEESVLTSPHWVPSLLGVLKSSDGIRALSNSNLLMLFSFVLIILVVSGMVRRSLHRWSSKSLQRWQHTLHADGDVGTRALAALAMTSRRYVVPLMVAITIGGFLSIETLDMVPKPLITIILDGLPVLILVFALNYFFFKALGELGLRDEVQSKVDRALRQRLDLLATITYIGYMLFQTVLANSLPEAVFFVVRAVLGVLLVLNVIWIIWLSKGIRKRSLNASTSVLATLVLLAAAVAELTGYRNISGFMLQGVVGTLIAYSMYQILSKLFNSTLDELDVGKSQWQKDLRQKIGVMDSDPIPGFIWLRLIVSLALWVLIIALLLLVWRVPVSEVKVLQAYILQGFTIGSVSVVPSKLVEALLVLSLLLIANGWFQRRLEKKWLELVRIDRGARESIATIANYVGVATAIIIALVVAGMDFSKLALVAGALSVGIGFGLQNIVNNFVSGLILLFERPIKTGDWIVAGGVEGLVKKISIRSTQIESFDHADIIVPNSELISGNLTNWLHKSWNGRIRLKIGVAYGSDTEKVRDILVGIARDHRQVILNNPRMHDPKVLFLSFGDSSLDMELRFFVRNIQDRFDIQSDINYAIDKAFRESDIEIPFPQRVVWMRQEEADKIPELDEVQVADGEDVLAKEVDISGTDKKEV